MNTLSGRKCLVASVLINISNLGHLTGRSNPEEYKLTMLINASEEVNVRRQAQARYQHSMPETLVLIVQTDFY